MTKRNRSSKRNNNPLARIRVIRWLRWLIKPPVFEYDEDKTSTAALLNTLLWVVLLGTGLFAGVVPVITQQPMLDLVAGVVIELSLVTVSLLVLMRLGYVRASGIGLGIMLWLAFTLPAFSFAGMHDTAITGYFFLIIVSGIVAGGNALLAFTLLCALTVSALFLAETMGWIVPTPPYPSAADDLFLMLLMIVASGMVLRYELRRFARLYARARSSTHALAESNRELASSQSVLQAQTERLARRTRYQEASATIVRDTASIMDMQSMLDRVAALTVERFGFDHVAFFLLSPDRAWAVLQAVSSRTGKEPPLPLGGRVRTDEVGVVGTVVTQGRYIVIDDVNTALRWADSPRFSDSRSQIALPLRARGNAFGVLDIQSAQVGAFREEDVDILLSLSDQIALTISNIRLLQQLEESSTSERRVRGELGSQAWLELLRAYPDLGVLSTREGVGALHDNERPEMDEAVRSGKATAGGEADARLAIPIRIGDQVIGVVDGHKSQDAGAWTREEILLLQTLTEQLNVALERARLYRETQRRAARERMVGEVTARMRESLEMQTVLKNAVQEIGQALGLVALNVQLGVEPESGGDGSLMQNENSEGE